MKDLISLLVYNTKPSQGINTLVLDFIIIKPPLATSIQQNPIFQSLQSMMGKICQFQLKFQYLNAVHVAPGQYL